MVWYKLQALEVNIFLFYIYRSTYYDGHISTVQIEAVWISKFTIIVIWLA